MRYSSGAYGSGVRIVSSRIGEGHGSIIDAPRTLAQTPQLLISSGQRAKVELTKRGYAHTGPTDLLAVRVMAKHCPDHVHL